MPQSRADVNNVNTIRISDCRTEPFQLNNECYFKQWHSDFKKPRDFTWIWYFKMVPFKCVTFQMLTWRKQSKRKLARNYCVLVCLSLLLYYAYDRIITAITVHRFYQKMINVCANEELNITMKWKREPACPCFPNKNGWYI